jgi:hypothetical protein
MIKSEYNMNEKKNVFDQSQFMNSSWKPLLSIQVHEQFKNILWVMWGLLMNCSWTIHILNATNVHEQIMNSSSNWTVHEQFQYVLCTSFLKSSWIFLVHFRNIVHKWFINSSWTWTHELFMNYLCSSNWTVHEQFQYLLCTLFLKSSLTVHVPFNVHGLLMNSSRTISWIFLVHFMNIVHKWFNALGSWKVH